MKILHILSSNCFSGAENVVCQIIDIMRNEPDIEMTYCSPDGPIRDELTERGILFVPLKAVTPSEIKRILREQKPDRIHAHDMRASVISSFVSGRIPLISHIHNNNTESGRLSIRSIAYLFAACKAAHIFWVSTAAYEGYIFHKFFRRKSEVLQNILNIDRLYEKVSQDDNRYPYDIVFVGRLTYPKNPRRLLRVIAAAAAIEPSLKAAVVGTGELEEEIRRLANDLSLQDHVDFLGFRKNPLRIMYDAKVMLMTSRWEGTPMCALEALALGLPIVSTPTDGLADLIEDGKNGFVSEDDAVLVRKILEIVHDQELRTCLSDYAKTKSLEINCIETYKYSLRSAYTSVPRNMG